MKAANIILTSRCNQNCPFCFYSEVEAKEISFLHVVNLLNQLRLEGFQSIILTGGEPSVSKNLHRVLEEIFWNEFNVVSIHTNGSIIQSKNVMQVIAKFKERVHLTISLHGSSASLHDSLVNSVGSFERASNLLFWATQNNVKTSINFAIMKYNIKDILATLDFTEKFKVYAINLLLVHDCTENLKFKAPISDVVKELLKILRFSPNSFRTDGIPYCLLRGYEQIVGEAYWPKHLSVISLKAKKYDYYKSLIYELRYWPKSCKFCMMREICMGVYREYKSDFELIYPGPIIDNAIE
ncbi:radical SAM protein [Chromatium okenii]|jgi:MoaA/NifB/PqqE/SkfB family radical SAM enzyme|uniref:radical SAM protein n=1 Tax=Chromatium okenii TaxID=61644 RepID=UPI0026EF9679|nr:radical SAM protein [Chromatium okenii]MBV5311031.1 radical SAM protein [Chromatium okenii]